MNEFRVNAVNPTFSLSSRLPSYDSNRDKNNNCNKKSVGDSTFSDYLNYFSKKSNFIPKGKEGEFAI